MLSISNNVSLPKNNSQFLKTPNSAAAFFDGTNDYIDASTLGSSISKTAGTISHWVKITASANNEILFSCSDGTSGNDKIQTVFMTNTSSGQFQAVYKSGGVANKAVYNFPSADIVNAGWFHLAMTYTISEANALTIKLYFNGALQNTFSGTADPIAGGVAFDRVILGKNANADNSYLQGFIDECAYYTRVLTADEILRIYNAKGTFNHITQTDVDAADDVNLLKQWLRFGDGGNDFVQDETTGIVDMSNNSLGSEIIANNDFSTNEAEDQANLVGGIQFASWNESPSSGSATFTSITNGYRRTAVTPTDQVWQQRIYQNISSSLDIGSVYRFTFTIVSSIDASFVVRVQELGSTNIQTPRTATTVLTANVPVTIDEYFVCTDNTDQYVDIWPSNKLMTEGQYYELSNLSLTKLQGNPAFVSGALINQDDNPTTNIDG